MEIKVIGPRVCLDRETGNETSSYSVTSEISENIAASPKINRKTPIKRNY